MQRSPMFRVSLFALSLLSGVGVASALEESDIEDVLLDLRQNLTIDRQETNNFVCGGLMNANDPRMHQYYVREALDDPFECKLEYWCNDFEMSDGTCKGEKCELIEKKGLRTRTLFHDNCSGGACNTPTPHTACSFQTVKAHYRHYQCDGAVADCYTYLPDLHYPESYYPYAFNCRVTYDNPPIGSEPDGIRGQAELIPGLDVVPPSRDTVDHWQPVEGSAVSVIDDRDILARDSSVLSLMLDDAIVEPETRGIQTVRSSPYWLDERFPNLMRTLGRLMHHPEVRLILPSGGFGLAHSGSTLFSRIFSSLEEDHIEPSPVEVVLGSDPDALGTIAEYLEQTPLLEVRYVPVDVLVPFANDTELRVLKKEWEVWKTLAEREAPLSTELGDIVDGNIEALESYIALQDSLREYRLRFPYYIDAVLSYTEKANEFFLESWLTHNRDRLREWQTAFDTYLNQTNGLRDRLESIYQTAATVTSQCLAESCRMDVVPVVADTLPWHLLPEENDSAQGIVNEEFILTGDNGAWHPHAFPLWEKEYGQRTRWHPKTTFGQPLPDLTIDFSEIFADRVIEIPVLNPEMSPLPLPLPPFDPTELQQEELEDELIRLEGDLIALEPLSPPLFDLEFPVIDLPDSDSLFLVPEPPIALNTWMQALDWRERRLQKLVNVCESSSPSTFLANEYMLYGSQADPTTVRATAQVTGFGTPSPFNAHAIFGGYFFVPWFGGVSHLPSLIAPPICRDCPTVRPQRFVRQHVQLETSWELLQNHLLTAIDEWNAEVRFWSVIDRDELESLEPEPWDEPLSFLKSLFIPSAHAQDDDLRFTVNREACSDRMIEMLQDERDTYRRVQYGDAYPSVLDTEVSQTSLLVPYLTLNYQALDCRLRSVCDAVRTSHPGLELEEVPVHLPLGCSRLFAARGRWWSEERREETQKPETIPECSYTELIDIDLDTTLPGDFLVEKLCQNWSSQILLEERQLLRTLVAQDSAQRGTRRTIGVFQSVLRDVRDSFLEPLRGVTDLVGAVLYPIPCLVTQCN